MRRNYSVHNRILQFGLLAVCCLLVLFSIPQNAYAAGNARVKLSVDPVAHSDNYSAVLYNNTNGLPTSEANAIAETSEGFIWIGSYSGLVRYDGNTFERMDSTTGIGSVMSLYVDSRDRLWIGTNEGGLALMEHGEYTFWTEADGIPDDKICTIAEDSKGVIYAGTTAGIFMITPDMELSNIDDPRVSGTFIEHIIPGRDGLMYVTTNEDDCFTLSDGQVKDYVSNSDSGITDISALLPDKEYVLKMQPGDKIFLYTDGISEATNAEDAMFGTDRMVEALNSDAEASPRDVLDNVRTAVSSFVGKAEQFDDMTMLCLEYKGVDSE